MFGTKIVIILEIRRNKGEKIISAIQNKTKKRTYIHNFNFGKWNRPQCIEVAILNYFFCILHQIVAKKFAHNEVYQFNLEMALFCIINDTFPLKIWFITSKSVLLYHI